MHIRHRYSAAASTVVALALLTACSSAPGVPAGTSATVGEAQGSASAAEGLVERWAAAWEGGDSAAMAELFTEDGVYIDNAFGAEQTGQDQVAEWVELTHAGFADPDAEVHDIIASEDGIAISWTFSAHMRGAPTGFSVPATTHFQLDGDKIARNTDTYNLADLLEQSGLPADYAPGA